MLAMYCEVKNKKKKKHEAPFGKAKCPFLGGRACILLFKNTGVLVKIKLRFIIHPPNTPPKKKL
jgi:hypothetical protein